MNYKNHQHQLFIDLIIWHYLERLSQNHFHQTETDHMYYSCIHNRYYLDAMTEMFLHIVHLMFTLNLTHCMHFKSCLVFLSGNWTSLVSLQTRSLMSVVRRLSKYLPPPERSPQLSLLLLPLTASLFTRALSNSDSRL